MPEEKKIILIQPDSPFLFEPLTFPNLGLLTISAYLKKNGYNPNLYDLTGGVKLPENLHADIFGFSCQITQFRDVVEMQKKLKEKNPNSLFVIGGPFPTHSSQECLDAGFDIVVIGEGEKAMVEIVDSYPLVKKGIYIAKDYVDPNFMPDWEVIDPLRYKAQLEGKKCLNIMTKRGNCPYRCGFCAKQEGKKSPLRFRTLDNIIKEIIYLRDTFGAEAIAIYDDEVFPSTKRDKDIFQALYNLGMPYRCMTRADNATREDLEFLKKTGCAEVCIGVESADNSILESIHKDMTIEQNTEFVKICKEIGLKVKTYLIMGLPGESKQSVEKMRNWLRETQPDNFDVSIFTPYPGSDIYNNKSNYKIDWDEDKLRELWFSGKAQYEGCAVWTPSLSSEEIEDYKIMIEKEFDRKAGGGTFVNSNQQNKKKYYLNEPYLKGKEKEYVLDVIESGWLSVKGKHTKVFEEKFAELVGVSHALAVQSGTAALHTALLALGVGEGDKIVIPNYTCAANVTSVLQCRATPVILDIEEETLGLDVNKLEELLKQEKPKVVMIVHVYGFPARDTQKIAEICKRENIWLVEDCCEAHGAELNGKKLGSFGDIAVFSVRSEKMMGVGEGGLVLTDSDELIENAFHWASRASPYRKGHPYWYQYYYSGVGMNYLMPHVLGALGRAQVENFEEIFRRKKAVGEKYQELLKNIPGVRTQKIIEGGKPSYWLNIAILENKSKNEVRKIGEKLMKEEIEIRPAFWPLSDQSFFREYAWGSQDVGKYIFEKGLVLPSSVFLVRDNCEGIKKIIDIFKDLL